MANVIAAPSTAELVVAPAAEGRRGDRDALLFEPVLCLDWAAGCER